MYDPDSAPTGAGSSEPWGVEFPNGSAVCKFVEFRRGDEGDIIVANKPDGSYYQDDDGQWWKRPQQRGGERTPVEESEVKYADYVYAMLVVVSPVDKAGGLLPMRVKLKGVHTYQVGQEWRFKLPGAGIDRQANGERFRKTGLFQQTEPMGFQTVRLDPESPLFETDESGCPLYISGEVSRLADQMYDPLEPVHILLHVFEPKLQAAAESGHLFSVRTSAISWVEWNSLQALSADDAAVINAQASQGEAEADAIRQQIRDWVGQQDDAEAAVQFVLHLAEQEQPDVDETALLASCKLATLKHIQREIVSPTANAGEKKGVSL